MTFLGVDNKVVVLANLFWNVIFFIFGLLVFLHDQIFKNSFNEYSGQVQIALVLANTFITFVYIGANFWMLLKYRYHPMTRRTYRPLLIGIRLFSICWSLALFILITYFVYVKFGGDQASVVAPLSYLYLYIMIIIIGIELGLVFLYLFSICLLTSCTGCLYYICEVNLENLDSRKGEDGLPFLNRPFFDQFRNVIGIGDEPDLSCPICEIKYVDEAQLHQLPCGHYFHKGCLDQWVINQHDCPVCGKKVVLAEMKSDKLEQFDLSELDQSV